MSALRAISLTICGILVLAVVMANFSPAKAEDHRIDILPNHYGALRQDSPKYYTIRGELVNNGEYAVANIDVNAKLLASNGEIVGFASSRDSTVDTNLSNYTLMPGYKIPFQIDFEKLDVAKLVSNYELTLQYDPASTKTKALSVTDSNFFKSDSGGFSNNDKWNIVGEIRNDGNQTASNVRVVGTLYDSSGKVIGMAVSSTEGARSEYFVKAGKTVPFSISSYLPPNSDVKSISLFVESYESVVVPEFPFQLLALAAGVAVTLLVYNRNTLGFMCPR